MVAKSRGPSAVAVTASERPATTDVCSANASFTGCLDPVGAGSGPLAPDCRHASGGRPYGLAPCVRGRSATKTTLWRVAWKG